MTETAGRRGWARPLTMAAVAICFGAVAAALIAAIGAGQEAWHFRPAFTVLRYAFFAAAAGVLIALIALVLAGRVRAGGLIVANLVALVVAASFIVFLGLQVRTAKSVPAIHDISTNLDDVPQFTRLKVRADNLDDVPDLDSPELKAMEPEARWKAVQKRAYGDLQTLRLPISAEDAIRRAEGLARGRGWEVARVDPAAGLLEATETSRFFRFKDDIVVRARPAPGGGSLVDMRSISRVGASDVGVNAKRVRAFLKDLQAG